MRLPLLIAISSLLLSGSGAAVAAVPAADPATEHRDAREQVPAALIGIWKVDLAASQYSGPKPKSALRTFQYTADGKLLVTFLTVGANGNYSTGHWAVQVDGTPGIEYHSAAGSLPYNVINFTKIDDANFNLIVSRHGAVDIRATYKLSADGQTLTYSYDKNIIVYRHWSKMDW